MLKRKVKRDYPVSGVSLDTTHHAGYVDLIVRIEIRGRWVEVIRTPYSDGGVIGHSVYSGGISECIDRAEKT